MAFSILVVTRHACLDDWGSLLALRLGSLLGGSCSTTQIRLDPDRFIVVRLLFLSLRLGNVLGGVFGASATWFHLLPDRFALV